MSDPTEPTGEKVEDVVEDIVSDISPSEGDKDDGGTEEAGRTGDRAIDDETFSA